MVKLRFFYLIVLLNYSFGQSVMLLNDSPFKLDVLVINAIGDTKGNLSLDPNQQITWKEQKQFYERNQSPTVPYTVIWYCKDGNQYGIWTNVISGSLVTAQGSQGQKICKIKKPKPGETNTNIND